MIIYGKNTVQEAVYAGRKIFNLFIDKDNKEYNFIFFLEKKNIKFSLVNKEFLNKLVGMKKHQGIVAKVKDYEYNCLNDYLAKSHINKNHRLLVLDQIQDPHNFGAILRTVEASGFDGIIFSDNNQVLINATVAKIASGALEYVSLFLVKNIYQAILKLKKNNIFIIGTDDKASASLKDIPLEKSLAIIVGNEGKGIRFLLKQKADLLVKIPMKGNINSLNVSVATALVVYSVILFK